MSSRTEAARQGVHELLAPSTTECFTQLSTLHEHLCPRQVLGVRFALLAGQLLDLDLPRRDKRLLAFVETDGCVVDSVSVASGCSVGHRTLRVVDLGRTAATFADTATRRAIRIWPHPDAREIAAKYCPRARSRWHAQRHAYEVMPPAELLLARDVELTVNLTDLIGRSGARVSCASCGEEIVNQREIIMDGATYCLACAGQSYYRPRLEHSIRRGFSARP